MSTNLFARLRRLLPSSPVLVGRVTAHHADDTSTVELPTQQSLTAVGGAVQTGSLIRARGTTVPVGQNAFVRDGVIESGAPDATAQLITVGRVVTGYETLAFVGSIADQTIVEDSAFSLALPPEWEGGLNASGCGLLGPVTWTVVAGALPAGMTLDALTGVVSGTPPTPGVSAGVVFRATDAGGNYADSGPVVFTVEAVPPDALFANVVLLLHGNGVNGGTVFTDSSSYNRTATHTGVVSTVADAGSFGGSAIGFGGVNTPSYVEFSGADLLPSDGSDYDLEFFFRLTDIVGSNPDFFLGSDGGVAKIAMSVAFTSDLRVCHTGCGQVSAINLAVRNHLLVYRRSGNTGVRWNGVAPPTGFSVGTFNLDRIRFGNLAEFGKSCAGVIEEVRLTAGVARYTADFTPPTAAFPNA